MVEQPGTALRERGIIVRVSAGTLVLVNSVLLVLAAMQPESFGLTLGTTLALGVPHLAIEAVIAAMPWQRMLPRRPRPWLLRGHVTYNVIGLLAALALAEGASTQALWLLAFNLVYSALILPWREHLAVALVSVVGGAAVIAATQGVDVADVVDLTALTGVALLASIGSNVVWSALGRAERARIEADESAAALHDALVAVHATTTGDLDRIMQATASAAVRGPYDMAAVYVLDGDEVRSSFKRVPDGLRVTDPDGIRGIVGAIAEHGSSVLDYAGPDEALLPEEARGQLRTSMVAPVTHQGEVVGALTAARTSGPPFSNGERAALELLADHVARGVALSKDLAADRAALERLQELDRLKRDFVATVSHEMRTPITIISGLTETLQQRRDTLDTAMKETIVTRLRANAATLERIVTGLLDAAGIDRGIVAVQQADVDVTALLRDTASRLEPLFDEHDLVLEVEGGLHCAGDPGLLERVLENLLNNAQRHTPAGTTVRLVGRARGDAVVVEVVDHGPGIPPEDLTLVLGRFVRGGRPNERSTRGLGLGLALADEVLRLHGSALEVESELGAGTTFRFSLVRTPAPQPALRERRGS